MNNPSGRRRLNSGPLEEFLEGWLLRQERLLDELLASTPPLRPPRPPPQRYREETKEEELMGLVSRVLGHYEGKSRDLHRNVQRWFSPPWCSPLECAFHWIAGFRPTVVFQLLSNAVNDLSPPPPQSQRIHWLRNEVRREERELANESARIQVSVQAPLLIDAARRNGWRPCWDISHRVEQVMEALRAAMEALVIKADSLRTRTVTGVLETLTPRQSIKFLTASMQLQRNIRTWDGTRRGGTTSITTTSGGSQLTKESGD